MKRRAELEAATRLRITESAMALHESVGPAQTSITAIAEKAGVRRSTVYRHFPDEETLFAACSSHWRALNPPPDLTGFAKAQGAVGIGPIESREKLAPAIADAVAQVRAGKVVVLEVIVAPEYSEGVAAGITATADSGRQHGYTRG